MTVEVLVLKEAAAGERRVAATPETVRKLVAAGASVRVEAGALPADAASRAGAEVVLCVQSPEAGVLAALRPEAVLVGMLHPQADAARAEALQARGIRAFPLERLPRTTRARPWTCSVRRPAWPVTRRC